MEDRGKVMPPLYDPEVVARTILAAAQRPVRNITVGGTGRFTSIARDFAPHLADRAIGWLLPRVQSTGKPKMPDSNLHSAGQDGQVYLSGERQGLRASPYTRARLHPGLAVGAAVGLAALLVMAQRRRP